MRLEQIAKLKSVVESTQPVPGSFVEWIDDEEEQHVVTSVVQRESEASPVATLAGGGFVVLTDADATDFRLVSPAVREEVPPIPYLLGVPGASLVVQSRTEIRLLSDLPDDQIRVCVPSFTPDDPTAVRCSGQCDVPADGSDLGRCPKCGCLVAWIYHGDKRTVYPAVGAKGASVHD